MRNLKIFLNIKQHYDILAESDVIAFGKRPQSGNLNSKANIIFCLSQNVLYSVNIDQSVETKLLDLKEFFNSASIPQPVDMWYRDIYDSLYICFVNGEILTIKLAQGRECTSHILEFEDIVEINWSPDEEYAVVTSKDGKLYLLNADMFTVSEISLSDSSSGERALINVGWGKKETQFHGSEGKKAALSQKEEIDSSLTGDSHAVVTTWRGDSSLFAIGYWCTDKNMRRVKIFNSEGTLQSVSEEIPGLLEPLCWKPQGNLITFCQRLPNKQVVGFMEKNGLKHGDFTVPKNYKVIDICWNETSSILCLVCRNEETSQEELLLWTVGNYHWYLKQTFKLKQDTPSKCIWWDKEKPNRLHILRISGDYNIFEWKFSVDSSYNSACEESSYVAVINGAEILVTSFKDGIIPPPMCTFTLKCPDAVNQVIFSPFESNNLLCAVLSSGSVAVFSRDSFEPFIFSSKGTLSESDLPTEILPLALWEWLDKDSLFFCYSENKTSFAHHLVTEGSQLCLKYTATIDGNIITCTRHKGNAIIQTSEGKLKKYITSDMRLESLNIKNVEPSFDVKVHESGIYSLSEWGRLYVDGSQIDLPSISGKVTSFLLRDPFILVTTSSHQLVIIHINDKSEEQSQRKLERGSRLVTTYGNLVILQAPRGNLETIQPRALTVLTVGELINNKCYREALCLLRKQRIDLNLIIDHNPKGFLADASYFVKQVDPQWLTLLITELSEEDVSKTSYSQCYKTERLSSSFPHGMKIKFVCECLLKAMNEENSNNKYTLPILSALVKNNKMGEAIKLATTDQALQHLMFIVDTNKLYSEALGVYDLETSLRIAEKSQKDPKEYIPYLNSLKKLEPKYMKFTIDKSLNRMQSALKNIVECINEHEDECFQFIIDNCLYVYALQLLKEDVPRYKYIAQEYAKYLFNKNKYDESGIMYQRAGDIEESIKAFIKAGNWRQAISTMVREKYSNERITQEAESIVNILASSQRYLEAAKVYTDWLHMPEKAVEMYIQGRHWREAVYIANVTGRDDLLLSIKVGLNAHIQLITDTINGHSTKIAGYVPRLEQVRLEKQLKPSFAFDEFSDTASETSSTSSFRTKSFQSKSSRNTKKMNRKMWSLKEGNPREEEALVATISQIIQDADKFIGDVEAICSVIATTFSEKDELGAGLQNILRDWLIAIENLKPKVWPKNPDVTEAEILDDKYKHPPELNVPKWELEILTWN